MRTFAIAVAAAMAACGSGGDDGGGGDDASAMCSDWGDHGIATLAAPMSVRALGASADGALLLAGDDDSGAAVLVRLAAGGAPDDAFGTAGRRGDALGGTEPRWDALAPRPGGGWLAAGQVIRPPATIDSFALEAVGATGAPDPALCSGGLFDPAGSLGDVTALAQVGDAVVAVTSIGLLRYASCARDAAFADGETVPKFPRGSIAADGSIAVAGYRDAAAGPSVVLARFDSDGHALGSFGTDGTVEVGVPTQYSALAALPDGSFAVAANVADVSSGTVTVVRVGADGALGASHDVARMASLASLAAVGGDALVIGVRGFGDPDLPHGMLVRVDATGAEVASYRTDEPIIFERATALPDGRVLAAGHGHDDGVTRVACFAAR